jgi:hypothetical protein
MYRPRFATKPVAPALRCGGGGVNVCSRAACIWVRLPPEGHSASWDHCTCSGHNGGAACLAHASKHRRVVFPSAPNAMHRKVPVGTKDAGRVSTQAHHALSLSGGRSEYSPHHGAMLADDALDPRERRPVGRTRHRRI